MFYFIDICLICLKHSNNLKCSKSRDKNGTSFEDKLEDFLPEYKLDLNIPTYICAQCGCNLDRIYEFKRKCLQNKTTYKKYAQQITTTDSSYKYLSVFINPDFINVKEEILDGNNYDMDILEYQTKINVDTVTTEEFIIKEEGNGELVLDDKSQSLLHEMKKETSDSDDTRELDKNIIEENAQISDNLASSPTENENINEHDERKCYVCNKIHLTKVKLKSNFLSHSTEQNKYRNNDEKICNCAALKQDIRKICDAKLYECEICNKSFRNRKILKTHQFTHPNWKPYTCGICNKSFGRLSHLKEHKLVHTGEKPFTCEVCNKSFRRLSHLKRHKLLHTDEQPLTREVCDKSSWQLSHLKEHKLVHTDEKPFTCEVCNKSFGRLSHLKDHKLLHTGEKPFACEVCNKSFGRLSHLKRHKLLHTDGKPLTCEVVTNQGVIKYEKT